MIFIDDRPLNLEVPRRLGMNVIHYQGCRRHCALNCESTMLRYSFCKT